MSSRADRLRDVVRQAGARTGGAADVGLAGDRGDHTCDRGESNLAEVLDGSWCESGGRRFLVIDRIYKPGYRHGSSSIADALPPSDGLWPRLSLLAGPGHIQNTGPASPERRGREVGSLMFVDLETTGLAGGAGTYAFLVGCAWFEPFTPHAAGSAAAATFRIRQFFLSDFGSEPLLLEAVARAASDAGALVTYNGKTFDVPLIDTRFVLHRMTTPFGAIPHIDMLHPARRLWKGSEDEGASCRLSAVERSVCGHVREGDVPGFEIPSRYFHYVRTGDARPLAAVLEHNRLDLLSLAVLTAYAAQLLEQGAGAARSAREAYGLGRLYERAGLAGEARDAYGRAIEFRADEATHAEALRAYAVLCRRERRYEEAADAWQRILTLRGCAAHLVREATDALAVHHEHRRRDPRTARSFALQSMRFHATPARREAIQYRLARLERKLAEPPPVVASLF